MVQGGGRPSPFATDLTVEPTGDISDMARCLRCDPRQPPITSTSGARELRLKGRVPISQYAMDEREAFVAMSRFLWQFANRAGDDLLTLLGDIGTEADGGTTDPAAWDDWLACVRSVVDAPEDPTA